MQHANQGWLYGPDKLPLNDQEEIDFPQGQKIILNK
jgi:hypothetical protein